MVVIDLVFSLINDCTGRGQLDTGKGEALRTNSAYFLFNQIALHVLSWLLLV